MNINRFFDSRRVEEPRNGLSIRNEILRLRYAPLRMIENWLQPHQIDQKLAPEVYHPAPGIFHVSCGGLFEDAFVNVVRDLVAQILLHFRFDSLFVERVDLSGINAVPPEKLPIIFPIPSGVAYVHEALVLDFSRNVTQCWESVRRGRTFWPKLFFLWKPERTNPGENFKPWKKQPAHRGGQTPDPAATNEINREVSGDQNAKRARFL